MSWKCAAVDHGVTFYSNGTIAPCCLIDTSYSKHINQLGPNVFDDLNTGTAPGVCKKCTDVENYGGFSARMQYNLKKTSAPGVQFVDFRNFNLCNAKCRTCGPYNSSQWAAELGRTTTILKQDIGNYLTTVITPSLQDVYYTGGEPFINAEHWDILENLVQLNYSKHVSLRYNSNLTTLKFKDKDILDLWKNFKSIAVNVSVDATGKEFEILRSGCSWDTVSSNINSLLEWKKHINLTLQIAATVSILNIWFIPDVLDYFKSTVPVTLFNLHHPDFLSLSAMPDSAKQQALTCLDEIKQRYPNTQYIEMTRAMIEQNSDQYLFRDALNHILMLDRIRGENLFDLLPFNAAAMERIFYE